MDASNVPEDRKIMEERVSAERMWMGVSIVCMYIEVKYILESVTN